MDLCISVFFYFILLFACVYFNIKLDFVLFTSMGYHLINGWVNIFEQHQKCWGAEREEGKNVYVNTGAPCFNLVFGFVCVCVFCMNQVNLKWFCTGQDLSHSWERDKHTRTTGTQQTIIIQSGSPRPIFRKRDRPRQICVRAWICVWVCIDV